jgi:hypothetical protein|tara:strand:+ start:283 stop:543 length:261 start_codon:yes stop_codon:yes gene_type:complete
MYNLFITLCLLGAPSCIDDNKLIVKSDKSFEHIQECQHYAETTFVDLVSKKYKDKWGLFGTLCIQKDYTDILKGDQYEILKEGTDV